MEIIRRRGTRACRNCGIDLHKEIERAQRQHAKEYPIRVGSTSRPDDRGSGPRLDHKEGRLVEKGVLQRSSRKIIDEKIYDHRPDEKRRKYRRFRRNAVKDAKADTQEAETGKDARKGANGKEPWHRRKWQDGLANRGKRGYGETCGAPSRRPARAALHRNDQKRSHEDLGNDEIHRQK
nr:hypothetical protein [Sinorhizobium meliloti]